MKHHESSIGKHAIVIGASIGGLLAARVLADRFERVTILERDAFPQTPQPRRGVPQGQHPHGLLSAGYRVLQRFFPDIDADLRAAGALFLDVTNDGGWFQNGGYLTPAPSDLRGVSLSRPALEAVVRACVLRLGNVSAETGVSVLSPVMDGARRVTGVTLNRGSGDERLSADLVVDASGRGSRSSAWLERNGFAPPTVSEIGVNMAYATRHYRRAEDDLGGRTLLIVAPHAPLQARGAVALAQEGESWAVTLIGMHGDHPPTDETGFLEFAQGLPTGDVFDLIAHAEPISEIVPYKYPASLRRHYEKLRAFPTGYLVLGDALCSFNPIFGQGMTVACLEAVALEACLSRGTQRLWQRFFKCAARVIDTAWMLAATADFAFSQTVGRRGPEVRPLNAYIGRLLCAAWRDPVLTVAFHRVANLTQPPVSLFAPQIVWRMMRNANNANPALRLARVPLSAGD